MDGDRGVVMVAYGERAVAEAERAITSLRKRHALPVAVIGDAVSGSDVAIDWPLVGLPGRWAKVNLYELSPFAQTMYLDADTRVHPRHGNLEDGFALLDSGWDLVICPSMKQRDEWLWHLTDAEREITYENVWPGVALQGGLFWFGRTPGTEALFTAWRNEWSNWQGPDQGALLRALQTEPIHTWLLTQSELIRHNFGAARPR